MNTFKEYHQVRVNKLLKNTDDYDDWGRNQRSPMIGDAGVLLDILHKSDSPDGFVVVLSGTDGSDIWLSTFFAEEIEPID